MKIAFDTNVLISGFLTTTGSSQHVLATAFKRHAVILSEYIIEEFESCYEAIFGDDSMDTSSTGAPVPESRETNERQFVELRRKLIQKIGIPSEPVTRAVNFLRKRALVLDIKENLKINFPDKKDIPILSLLEASKANYFVTGDKKLLSLKKFGPTLFLTPREAMEILEDNYKSAP